MKVLKVMEDKPVSFQLDILISSIDYLYVHTKELKDAPKQ
jgi:hypothetical protein